MADKNHNGTGQPGDGTGQPGDGTGQPGDGPADVEFTPPSFVLKAKAPRTSRPLSEAIEAAQAAIADLAKDYPRQASVKIAELEAALRALPTAADAAEALKAMFMMSLNIRGEGGTFGFPLATEIAASLCAVLEDKDSIDDALLEAIDVHIDSLKLVIVQPIKGDGGAQGAELLAGLQKVSAVNNPADA